MQFTFLKKNFLILINIFYSYFLITIIIIDSFLVNFHNSIQFSGDQITARLVAEGQYLKTKFFCLFFVFLMVLGFEFVCTITWKRI